MAGADDTDRPLHERIDDADFRRAVEFIDAGDDGGLHAHLATHPTLISQRAHFDGGGYFADPTLLAFVAENPIRNRRLPMNIVEIARILIDAGADANDGTLGLVASGLVPRECGVQLPLIAFLCERGAAPDDAMLAALAHGEFAAAEALLRHGATLDLPVAAAFGRTTDARRLLAESTADERQLALALSAQHGHADVVRLLLEAGEDPNRLNPAGVHAHSMPLHQAALAGHLGVVEVLVEHGARLDVKDTAFDGTPLGWAIHGHQTEVADYLRRATSP